MSTPTIFKLAERLRAGETVYTGWCGLGEPLLAESIAREGFTSVLLDQQHGLYDVANTAAAIHMLNAIGTPAPVRIPVGAYAVASRMLDVGAAGIVAPMINSAADARAFVSHVKFPPLGDRSWGPARALALSGLDFPGYLTGANNGTLAIAMVETRAALDALDDILGTPGIDGVLIGPSDLSIALSNGTEVSPLGRAVDAALDHVAARCAAHGKIASAYCPNADRAVELSKRGFRFLAVASDTMFARAGAAAALRILRG